ncbi:MAG: hypothetical protein BAA04_04890 [Firmicutes bacterium ZCTH02-B6]|nr:MAG: hypothetical protein BAA04_04890 [Firmicutes bacterium ZCTH02-B6]
METFDWPCDPAQIDEEIITDALISEFGIGPEQRRTKRPPRRRWTLRFRKDQVTADAIWSFYVARRGAYEAFLWTNPLDGQTYTVRFERDDLTRNVFWKCVYEIGLTLIEVV